MSEFERVSGSVATNIQKLVQNVSSMQRMMIHVDTQVFSFMCSFFLIGSIVKFRCFHPCIYSPLWNTAGKFFSYHVRYCASLIPDLNLIRKKLRHLEIADVTWKLLLKAKLHSSREIWEERLAWVASYFENVKKILPTGGRRWES